MRKITLGRTGITVNKNGFGALPIQRRNKEDAIAILRKAYDGGIRFFDTARSYSDSEEKIGAALSDVRKDIIISTKIPVKTAEEFWPKFNTCLEKLNTDYVDILQFHNQGFCPKPGDGTGLYEAMLEAKEQGKIRFIGITSHKHTVAKEAVESGLYDTLQYPFSYLATDVDLNLVKLCQEKNVGFIAMKSLSGGLITNSALAYAFAAQFEGLIPIWGIQREKELDEFLSYQEKEPVMTEEFLALIEKDKKELAGEFCRGCGYCLPCPAGIDIPNSARMQLMLRRAVPAMYLTDEWKEKMKRIENCIGCNHCKNNCPYGLDTPRLLKEQYEDYKTFM